MSTFIDQVLPPAPREPLDETGAPRLGAFSGSLERVDLSPLMGTGLHARWNAATRQKTWQYAMLTSREVIAALAIVDLGYASNCFCFVVERQKRAVLFERSFLGLPGISASVGERPGVGARASFHGGGAEVHFERVNDKYLGTARIGSELSLHFTLETADLAPALTVVVPTRGGVLNVSQKWSGMPAQGALSVGERHFDLAGGFGGLDYTRGLLGRETLWRWAFGAGVDSRGNRVGFNLGEGLNSALCGENALWSGAAPALLPEVRFTFERAEPLSPWHIRSEDGSVDLTFHGAGAHREARNLLLAKSRFVQVAGEFSGRLRGPGGSAVEVTGLPGMVEDQFARW
jgi:hypothetical protein